MEIENTKIEQQTQRPVSFGELMRQRRKEEKLTIDKLAVATGLSRSYIWLLEKDRFKQLSPRAQDALFRTLGISLFDTKDTELTPEERVEHIRNGIRGIYSTLYNLKDQVARLDQLILTEMPGKILEPIPGFRIAIHDRNKILTDDELETLGNSLDGKLHQLLDGKETTEQLPTDYTGS